MTTFALDAAVRDLTSRLRKLELSVARNRPASGVSVGDTTGLFGDPGTLTLEEILELIGSAAVPGVWWKEPVDAATTANIDLATDLDPGDTIDGVVLVDLDRVLVKNQTDAFENGIYVVGSDIRSLDMDESAEVVGAGIYVVAGTTNGATLWFNTNTSDPVIDTDAITFDDFSTVAGSLGSITDGITTVAPVTTATFEPHTVSGTTPNAAHALNRLVTVADAGAAYEFDLADGNVFDLTLTEDCTLTIAAGAVSGYPETLVVILRQDGTGGWTVTWPGAVTWQDTDGTTGGAAPTLFTAATAVDTCLQGVDIGPPVGHMTATLNVNFGSVGPQALLGDSGEGEIRIRGVLRVERPRLALGVEQDHVMLPAPPSLGDATTPIRPDDFVSEVVRPEYAVHHHL